MVSWADALSCAGAGSLFTVSGADSCAGADSLTCAGSCAGADSGAGVVSSRGADSSVVLGRGACAGGVNGLVVPVEVCVPLVERREPVVPWAFELLRVRPGNAFAATSENTAVSATEPAISQRLVRRSLRSAASRALVG